MVHLVVNCYIASGAERARNRVTTLGPGLLEGLDVYENKILGNKLRSAMGPTEPWMG